MEDQGDPREARIGEFLERRLRPKRWRIKVILESWEMPDYLGIRSIAKTMEDQGDPRELDLIDGLHLARRQNDGGSR